MQRMGPHGAAATPSRSPRWFQARSPARASRAADSCLQRRRHRAARVSRAPAIAGEGYQQRRRRYRHRSWRVPRPRRAGVQYSQRVVHTGIRRTSIASIAGPLAVGAVAPWSVTHSVPIEDDEHGRVTVSRTISSGTLDCKEIVFSVDRDRHPEPSPPSSAFYVALGSAATAKSWKWASAEPATPTLGRIAMTARCVSGRSAAASAASLTALASALFSVRRGCALLVDRRGERRGRRRRDRASSRSNPAIGIGVGIAVQAATDEAVEPLMTSAARRPAESAIAALAGAIPAVGDNAAVVRSSIRCQSRTATARCASCANSTARLRPARSSYSRSPDGDGPNARGTGILATRL